MSELANIRLQARYNRWMNDTLLEAAGSLPVAALIQEQGAYFGSILRTFNHLLVSDIIWLRRFSHHPTRFDSLHPLLNGPKSEQLDALLYDDIETFAVERQALDILICEWCDELSEADLEAPLQYSSVSGITSCKRMGFLLLHMFNHQTHHRGQITTLLSQQGLNIGLTDFLTLIPESH